MHRNALVPIFLVKSQDFLCESTQIKCNVQRRGQNTNHWLDISSILTPSDKADIQYSSSHVEILFWQRAPSLWMNRFQFSKIRGCTECSLFNLQFYTENWNHKLKFKKVICEGRAIFYLFYNIVYLIWHTSNNPILILLKGQLNYTEIV